MGVDIRSPISHGSEPKDGRIPLRNGAFSFKNRRTPLHKTRSRTVRHFVSQLWKFSLKFTWIKWTHFCFSDNQNIIWGFKVIREGMDASLLKASQDRNYITSSGRSRKSNFHATKTNINSSPLANSGSVPLLDLSKMFPTCFGTSFLGLWRCFQRGTTSKHLPSQGKQFWAQDSSKFSHWGGGSREIWLAGYLLNGLLQDQNRACECRNTDFLIPPPTKIGARK